MVELGLVLGLLTALIGGMALVAYAPWDWLFGGGVLFACVGLLVGVPTGLWYHVLLYRALRPRGALPRNWWLRPDRLHALLAEDQLRRVMRPFRWGAAGFVLSIVGCALLGYGAWRSPPG
jgi:hypothetical protein